MQKTNVVTLATEDLSRFRVASGFRNLVQLMARDEDGDTTLHNLSVSEARRLGQALLDHADRAESE